MTKKKIKPLRSIVIPVKGTDYTFNLYSRANYEKLRGDDSNAITLCEARVVDFCDKLYTIKAVFHEIFHALLNECNTNSADLDIKQTEELCAEIIANHYFEIGAIAQKLLHEFMRDLEDEKKD